MKFVIIILSIISILALLALIGFGITWVMGKISKKQGMKITGKTGTLISGILFLFLLLVTGISGGIYSHQTVEMNKNFKNVSGDFKSEYISTAAKAEEIGNSEDDFWSDSIDISTNKDSTYNVNKTVDSIVDVESSDIKKVKKGLKKTELLLSELKKNDTGKYSYDTYEKSYINLKKMVNLVSSPSGSYYSFGNKFSDLDHELEDSYSSL